MKRLIAIDPGASGGIAWTDDDGIVRAEPMPEGMTAQADWFSDFYGKTSFVEYPKVIMEKAGAYQPGNSGVAAATFARHCGHLEAMLYVMGYSVEQISPQKWMKPFNLPRDKAERKRAVKEQMARLYPHLTVTLKTADALGILTWASGR